MATQVRYVIRLHRSMGWCAAHTTRREGTHGLVDGVALHGGIRTLGECSAGDSAVKI